METLKRYVNQAPIKMLFPTLWLAFLVLLMLFTTMPVLAFDARGGKEITITSGEVVDDDLYVAANTIIIDGTISGDLCACGRTITVNGAVKGSIMAVGETVLINGDVGHTVRAVGKTISISGNVKGDVMVCGGDVNIASTAKIVRDLLFGAGNAHIAGLIERNIKGQGGEITISNGVKGNINLGVASLTILPTANIQGNLTYTGKQEANIQSGAQISGITTHNLPKVEKKQAKVFSLGKVLGFLMAFISGLIIILLAPKRLTSIAEAIRSRPWPSVGWGALILFLTPIAAIIVCITIIGIPAGLIVLALWG